MNIQDDWDEVADESRKLTILLDEDDQDYDERLRFELGARLANHRSLAKSIKQVLESEPVK